jgi:alpha-galactosidase
MKRPFLPTLLLLLSCAAAALGRPFPDLAKSPPMGWNSWNWHGKKAITEQVVEETIDAMVAHGLRDAGYVYVVVDGGWRDTKLGPESELLPHPVKFPRGMKRLADHAHARGLKFGLHTTPGTHDCGGDAVGGFGREEKHIRQFVEWGLDFVKVDKCRYEPGWTEPRVEDVYRKWDRLLAACGRPMIFSISAYVFRPWNPEVCHMARTTLDIKARIHAGGAVFDYEKPVENFLSVMAVAEINNRSAAFAGNGYWNDPDMMVTGAQGLNPEEQKAHFALWCVMSSPLMLGNDPRAMTPAEKELILNREAIAIDLDPTEQGRCVRDDGDLEVWAKKLTGGRTAVLLLNRHATAGKSITLRAADLGRTSLGAVRDVFAKKDLGTSGATFTRELAPHTGCFLLLSPTPAR